MAARLPAIVLWLVWGASLQAQSLTHLSGVVLDPADAAVPAASITVVDQDTGFRRIVVSQNDGAYAVSSLRPGTYMITIRKDGFRTLVRSGVKLDVGQPARLDFRLSLGSMLEVMTVEGSPPLLNTEDASLGTLITRENIERLPLNGRGLLSLLELAPGTIVTPATRGEAGQFTANGQRPNTHYFTLDGVSLNSGVSGGAGSTQVTGGALPGMTALGSFHGIAALDSLAEFRIQTATSAPEFGRLPGAQVVLSSRSGSNEFHGTAVHFLRNEALDANDWFVNRSGLGNAPLRMRDYGATLGGPLKKDRTFFFLAYEGMRLRQPFAWRAPVPSIAAREEATGWVADVLRLFPEPNGGPLASGLAEWTGRNQRPSRLDTGSARLDHAFGSRVNVFTRYNEAPSFSEFGSSQIDALRVTSRGGTAGVTLRLRPGWAFDVRFNRSYAAASSSWRPATGNLPPCFFDSVARALGRSTTQCDYLARFSIAGVGEVASGPESDRSQSQSHLAVVSLFGAGSHQIRAGFDYRRLSPWRRDRAASLSVIAETVPDFLTSSNLWIASAPATEARTSLSEISAFVQDTWRMSSRLTATLGVRWELIPEPQPTSPDLEPYRDSALWQRRYDDLGPRLGLAFRPMADGNTVIRAGAGVYYDSSFSIATDLVNGGPFSLGQFTNNRSGFVASYLGYAFAEGLRTPWVTHWSVTAERALASRNVISLGYSGASGNALFRRELGAPISTELLQLVLATNHGESSYHALDFQYRGRIGSRLQTLVSYAWAHSIDNSSSDAALHWISPTWSAASDRGPSDFDVRHSLAAAFTYQTQRGSRAAWQALTADWQIDGIVRARTGFPLAVAVSENATGLTYANAFRPDVVPGQPLWITDRNAPDGRRLSREAFVSAPAGEQGNLGRNAIPGFGMGQVDLALRREFGLGPRVRFLVGLEGFNIFNQALFADPVRYLSSPLFGESPSMLNLMLGTGSPGSGLTPVFQAGGPRSLQVGVRLRF